ncbi:MAG: hypothetical protein J0H20_08460 [Rhizobiales bacterium]|nr:hypothetical protein [Hyphomicrobiales bacterium]
MTAELSSAVIDPPSVVGEPVAAEFEPGATAAAVRETARRDPAAALTLLNRTTLRYALKLLDATPPEGSLAGWSRPNPSGDPAQDERTLAVEPSGKDLSGRQPVAAIGSAEGAILLIAPDKGGDGYLLRLDASPHLRVDEAIFDRPGFRQRWIELAEPQFFAPISIFPAATLQPALRRIVLAEELLHAALDLGILEGFWDAARAHITTRTRPWQGQSLAKATDDPHLLRRYGEYTATVHAAQGLFKEAVDAVTSIPALPGTIDAVSAARAYLLLAGRTLISGTIELLGAGATSGRYGFDLYWRDFTAHAVAHPPHWPLESIGRRLAHPSLEEPFA